jgi:cysteinyl-tRNA synthetase
MIIFNSLSRKKDKIPSKKVLKIFVCGPTVYDYPHIGNARSFIFFDSLVKYLRSKGQKVFYLQNITDIDDKIIKKANEQKTSWKKISRFFEKIYHQNEKKLNITSVDKYARATEHIKEIEEQIKLLLKNGLAYEIKNDGIYFDTSRFKNYGKLSQKSYKEAEKASSRIEENPNKRNKADFVLWKFKKPNEPFWNSSLGKGRPGWHIEDTAISVKYFGPQYDIHGGGIDLKFPHHEAEIAQAEGAYKKSPFVKIWIHTGHLLVNGEKMSKSLGNFITIEDFLKKSSGNVLRLIILSTHWRAPINFKEEILKSAELTWKNLKNFLLKIKFIAQKPNLKNKRTKTIKNKIKKLNQNIEKSLENDFNTPKALGEIFAFIKEIEKNIWNLNQKDAQEIEKAIEKILENLGFKIDFEYKIPKKIIKIAEKREIKRKNKEFKKADLLRNKINELGYIVEDTPRGPFIFKKDA